MGIEIQRLQAVNPGELSGLCDVLMDCVQGGASVSFMHPMTAAKAEAFWRDAGHSLDRGGTHHPGGPRH